MAASLIARQAASLIARMAPAALALAGGIAAAQAQGQPLGQTPARTVPSPAAVAQLQGAWELSSQGGARKCRLTLRAAEAMGGRAVGFPGPCRRALPVLNRIAAWSVSEDGFVRLVDAAGVPVISFSDDPAAQRLTGSADGAVYEFDSLGRPRRYVARPAAPTAPRIAYDPAKAPARDTIPGTYGMLRYGGQEVCRIALGTQPGAADGRFLASYPTRCRDKGLQVFDVVAWRYSGGKIHLIARRGHEMTLVLAGEDTWQKDPPGGTELALRKIGSQSTQ